MPGLGSDRVKEMTTVDSGMRRKGQAESAGGEPHV